MLQRLVELKPRIFCDSVHGAITEIVQQLLVTGNPVVELDSNSSDGPSTAAQAVFDRVREILIQARFLDGDVPLSETATGLRRIRIPNPYQLSLHLPVRIRITPVTEPAAALLQTFLILRVRYQSVAGTSPSVRIEASATDEAALDSLYLIGDAFTERYPVSAEWKATNDTVVLRLTGEQPRISGGLTWAREDYVRCRDASLLIRPLRDALDELKRPLVVPREVRGSLGIVRVRLPARLRTRPTSVRWLATLQDLKHPAGDEVDLTGADAFGAHLSFSPQSGGYVAEGGDAGTEAILPVRCIAPTASPEIIVPEAEDGSIAITFEAIGGAREIGANSYYYAFGHRGLLIDAGFDATRDGWLGLPDIERIPRLDAVILTHAHLDHIGALPPLLAAFPDVPIYCTHATYAVLSPQLEDSAKVGDIRFNQTGEAPALSRGLVRSIRPEQFRLLDYRARREVPEIPGLTFEFYDAGHIIGSACTVLEFSGASILHTGDISVEDQHLLRGMPVGELEADHVVMEGTYCGEPDFTRYMRREAVDKFLVAVAERIDAGGSVLVPAFSLGRAQELVGMLVDWNDATGRSVPIWTVGMVNTLNEVSARFPAFLPGLSGNPFARVRSFPTSFKRDATEEERRAEYARAFFEVAGQAPCVVIASHGMLAESTGSYCIARAILAGEDPRHGIFLCGYMDPRTPGFRLRWQHEEPTIDFGSGDTVPRTIPAERIQFHRLTAHASYEELVEVALRTAKHSVAFIHGDGSGLDSLIEYLHARLQDAGRELTLRAPAIGERMLLQRVQPPENWNLEKEDRFNGAPTLGPGRKFDRKTGLFVQGLTPDERWALIPIGQSTVDLALGHDRFDASRIERVELRPGKGPRRIVFDRERGVGDLSRITLSEPGWVLWAISAREPDDRLIEACLEIYCGAELRSVRTVLDSAAPVLELEVGGVLEPHLLGAESGAESGDPKPLDLKSSSWDPIGRILRLYLQPFTALGSLEDVQPHIKWPNGFPQRGPSVGSLSIEPRVEFDVPAVRVGSPCQLRIRSTPRPLRARIGSEEAAFDDREVNFHPKRPGVIAVELEYATFSGEKEWREIGVIDVPPAAIIHLPASAIAGSEIELLIQQIDAAWYGKEIALSVAGEIRDRWSATSEAHPWSGIVGGADALEIALLVPASGLTLWAGTLRVYEAIALDLERSLMVTTADGSLEAELAFLGPSDSSRVSIENALSSAGFVPRGWANNILRVVGSVDTVGLRVVPIADGARRIELRIATLSDLHLSLSPSGPLAPGASATLRTAGGELGPELRELDNGPLTIEVDRVKPLFDALSASTVGSRIHFSYPGHYSIALIASGRRLATLSVEVQPLGPRPVVAAAAPIARCADSAFQASVVAAELLPAATTAILSQPGEPYRVLQEDPVQIQETLWEFLFRQVTAERKVLVSWPSLSLPETAGRLLRRVRAELPNILVAHLAYPAPRGEIANDEVHARSLRAHRVLCSAPANATIDRQDAYFCPKCSGTPKLITDSSQMWQECPECRNADRDLVLTLSRMRSSDADVLFADFRIAKYLSRGSGRRYAGAFGRSVRCSNCHGLQGAYARPSAWERTELRNLLRALSEEWDPNDESRSIRRAAYVAARRTRHSGLNDISRLLDLMRRLIDSGVAKGKSAVDPTVIGTLEAGLSLCCHRSLAWSSHRIAGILVDLEQLLNPLVPRSVHPSLPFGQAGIRALLALVE